MTHTPMRDAMPANEKEWKEQLTPEEYAVLREKATEPPFSGEYVKTEDDGMYHCKACGAALFSSETKFEAHCGWPSFWAAADEGAVKTATDTSHGMVRTEVMCAKCGSHLGHVFDDGPADKTGKRFCINSIALDLKKK